MRGLWVPSTLTLLVGCYDPPATSERFDESIVITTRDEAVDFGEYRSFFLRPEIRVLSEAADGNVGGAPIPGMVASDVAQPLLDETRENLIERGFVEATTMVGVDLAVEAVYLRAVNTDYYCYYWWDASYWDFVGYDYYYPGGCSAGAWRSGMLVTHAVDLRDAVPPADASQEGLLEGIWYSGVYGAELDSTDYVADRAVAGIRQAFEQSPYFTTNP